MSTTNRSFILSRTVNHPVTDVYAAFADSDIKQRWFKGSGSLEGTYQLDFQVGGRETNEASFENGMVHRFEATYFDIVPEQRIIYCYEMFVNGQKTSVSLATIGFQAMGQQTQLTIGESGIFFNELDTMRSRQQVAGQLFDALIDYLGQ